MISPEDIQEAIRQSEMEYGIVNSQRLASVRLMFTTGMLGSGLSEELVMRGIGLGVDAILADGGSTDSGPYYLGAAEPKTTESAVAEDLRILLTAARAADIPLVIGSCGTNGSDNGVNWIKDMVIEIALKGDLEFRLATIYSEQPASVIVEALQDGRIVDLAPSMPISEDIIRSCQHIVGVMGHEPMAAALAAGADVVLAGRATDTALVAAISLPLGFPPGPTWHAAKTVECGPFCTTDPLSGPVITEIDMDGFSVESVDPKTACTPTSVAAHMLYENANPFRMREPGGVLDTSDATYTAIDDRRVRVEGSRFETADQVTIKLEGSAVSGYETVSIVAIRDPSVVEAITTWSNGVHMILVAQVERLLGLEEDQYMVDIRRFGADGVLGDLERDQTPPREIAVALKVRASDQHTATAIAKLANPLLLHMPLPDMDHLPSFAFPFSPAEFERGPSYEFVLNHSVEVAAEGDMFRCELREVSNGR
jgi:Acyclic terpene utilisation family protein AtuA